MKPVQTSLSPDQVLFSRYEDGLVRPVRLAEGGGWQVEGLGTFKTNKDLLAALTGHPEGRHWSPERYFRLAQAPSPRRSKGRGRPRRPKPSSYLVETNIFDVLPMVMTSPAISIAAAAPQQPPRLGIDLAKRGHEVRKLLFAGFGRRMFMSGSDPEDVLQEVYKALLVRNAGKCPWDESKSSFGHYVHMVISCVLSNYHRKQHRITEMEQVGLRSPTQGDEVGDAASNTTIPAPRTVYAEEAELLETADDFADYLYDIDSPDALLATKLLPLLVAGVPKDHLAKYLHTSNAAITRSLSLLRKSASAWKDSRKGHSTPSENPVWA